MNDQNPKKNIVSTETAERLIEVSFLLGLLFVFFGLGLTVGWGWGLTVDGLILIATAAWAVTPAKGGE